MKVHKIYGDICMPFGKYRGTPVVDVLAKDPGYIYWTVHAGMATLEPDVAEVVNAWVKLNPKDAKSKEWSAKKFLEEHRLISSRHENVSEADDPVKPEKLTVPVRSETPAKTNESWGTW